MALRAVGCVQNSTCLNQLWILNGNTHFAASMCSPTRAHDHRKAQHCIQEGSAVHTDRSTLRSSIALNATMTVERLMNSAATAGESSMPAEAATPAASGMATTL